jgi:hypothetical protein
MLPIELPCSQKIMQMCQQATRIQTPLTSTPILLNCNGHSALNENYCFTIVTIVSPHSLLPLLWSFTSNASNPVK